MNDTKTYFDPKANPMGLKRQPFTMVDNKVIDDKALSTTTKAVYMALSRHASNAYAECYPSRKKIGVTAGCSIRSVDRALKHLTSKGYIDYTSGYEGRSNQYQLLNVFIVDL